MIECKSSFKTVYVSPRGTSECPVCGDKLKHQAWGISKCETCGVDYDRLAITPRLP
ncbi:MAG: zinc ribbon domain-containing protein [Conexivisphaerales archaeon]